MTILLACALSLIVLVVQTTLLDPVRIAGIAPDLVLVLVYLAGFSLGAPRGSMIGAVSGLMMDLLSAGPPGLNMATKAAAGCLAGLAGRAVLTPRIWSSAAPRHMITLGLVSLAQGGMTYGMTRLLGEPPAWWSAVGYIILPQAVYDGLSGGALAWVLAWYHGRRGYDAGGSHSWA